MTQQALSLYLQAFTSFKFKEYPLRDVRNGGTSSLPCKLRAFVTNKFPRESSYCLRRQNINCVWQLCQIFMERYICEMSQGRFCFGPVEDFPWRCCKFGSPHFVICMHSCRKYFLLNELLSSPTVKPKELRDASEFEKPLNFFSLPILCVCVFFFLILPFKFSD